MIPLCRLRFNETLNKTISANPLFGYINQFEYGIINQIALFAMAILPIDGNLSLILPFNSSISLLVMNLISQ